jgi:2-polyprenyl-6-methoxyphenol hydroxylase-like FAD-dependent oxidoreductase
MAAESSQGHGFGDGHTKSMPPLLVIGAGIIGLTLAQACRENDIPYEIFERDAKAEARGAGWALTIHW